MMTIIGSDKQIEWAHDIMKGIMDTFDERIEYYNGRIARQISKGKTTKFAEAGLLVEKTAKEYVATRLDVVDAGTVIDHMKNVSPNWDAKDIMIAWSKVTGDFKDMKSDFWNIFESM